MSEIKLSPAQQRRMDKLAERVDRVSQADKRYFERFPDRHHRVRVTSAAEIEQQELLEGKPTWMPPGYRMFTVVWNIAVGARMRLFVRYLEDAETDLDEATAKSVFLCAATPHTWKIEAQIREAVERRG